jgi:hypothetical protein
MIDAQFKRGSQYIKRLVLGRGAIKVSKRHGPNSYCRDLWTPLPKLPFLHCVLTAVGVVIVPHRAVGRKLLAKSIGECPSGKSQNNLGQCKGELRTDVYMGSTHIIAEDADT